MVDKNPKIDKRQIEEPCKEVLKEIVLKKELYFSYKNVPRRAKPYAIPKHKFEALQKVFSVD